VSDWEHHLGRLEQALDRLEAGDLPDLAEPGDLGEIPEPLRERAETVLARIGAIETSLRLRRAEVARRRAVSWSLAQARGTVLRA
jgi:hypothetical protein